MNAGDFLTEAKAIIQDRGMDYGHPTDNMQRTARLWSAYLEMPIADYQVAAMTATGGVLLLGIAFKLLNIKRIEIGNLLPALALAPLFAILANSLL